MFDFDNKIFITNEYIPFLTKNKSLFIPIPYISYMRFKSNDIPLSLLKNKDGKLLLDKNNQSYLIGYSNEDFVNIDIAYLIRSIDLLMNGCITNIPFIYGFFQNDILLEIRLLYYISNYGYMDEEKLIDSKLDLNTLFCPIDNDIKKFILLQNDIEVLREFVDFIKTHNIFDINQIRELLTMGSKNNNIDDINLE